MMKHELVRYDAYKDSGVEWLDEVPEYWKISRIKEKGSVKARVGWKALKASEYVDDGFAFLSTPNIKNKDIDFKNVNCITYERYVESPEIMLKEDDILLAKDGSTLGIVNIVTYLPRETTVNSSIGVLRFNKTVFNKYLFYQIESKYIQDKIQLKKGGMGVPHLFQQDINNFIIFIPPLPEQNAIAAYLDTKTAQIDRKIDLLTQKATQYGKLKQSLINETVTRGLDKTVAMKDSGVEWIGEVPEHWVVKRIKEVSIVVNGATPKSSVAENWGGELSWVTTDDLGKLNTKFITDTKRKITEKGSASCGTTICPIGSVVISGRAPIGHIGILSIKASSNQGCKTLVLNYKLANNFYVYYSLLSSKSKLEALGRGTTFIELSTKELGLFNLPMPSLLEQKAIADYLDEKTAHIDRIIETINTQIDKLKELRKTLINDVVTGKIKVA
jgi:type I restriction enzyme, S subunit